MSSNRIDQLGAPPARLSTNVSIDRQTPRTDFGDRVKAGLDNTAGAVGVAASMIPGASIISAAVSSASSSTVPAQGFGGYGGHAYSSSLSAGTLGGSGTLNTTLGSGVVSLGTPVGSPTGLPTAGGTGGSINGVNYGGDSTMNAYSSKLQAASDDNFKLLDLQMQMQRENQVFSTISNVLKVRHDTVKNSISNVR